VAQEPPPRLVPRTISEADRVWLPLFSAGERHYWELEVTDYLQDQALPHWAEGWSTTHLFSLADSPEIVGYISACVHHWTMKKTKDVFPQWDAAIDWLPDRVPILRLPYLAVAEKYQAQGFGTEMFLRFEEMVAVSPGSPRFMYLDCWEDNAAALRFYKDLRFVPFETVGYEEVPYEKHPGNLVRLAYDRFLLPTKA